jgi:hypothetical protein
MLPLTTTSTSANNADGRLMTAAMQLFRGYLGDDADRIHWGSADDAEHISGLLPGDTADQFFWIRYAAHTHRQLDDHQVQMHPDEAMHVAVGCPADTRCQFAWMRFFGRADLTNLAAGTATEVIECATHGTFAARTRTAPAGRRA